MMPLEVLIANYADLQRLRQLEAAGHFQPGFVDYASNACIRVLIRVLELAVVDMFIPYPGPTITE